MPSLAVQFSVAVLTSFLGCALLFLFSWHNQLPPMGGLSVPLALSLLVFLSLAFTLFLCLGLKKLPEFKMIAKIEPERQQKIVRLLRADAYTYLLVPLMVLLTLGWQQAGNPWLLWSVFLLLILTAKILILFDLFLMRKKK